VAERLFICWRRLSRRSIDLARALGLKVVVIDTSPPLYREGFRETKRLIEQFRPEIVFAQLPQGPLLYCLTRLKKKYRFKLVADVHTSFLCYENWKELVLNAPFKKLLKECDLVITHSDYMQKFLPEGCRAMTVYDPPPREIEQAEPLKRAKDYVIVPASFSYDEPIVELLEVVIDIAERHGLDVVVTGDYIRQLKSIAKFAGKVVLTGFLKYEDYVRFLKGAQVVITASTRSNVFLHSLAEAIVAERPFVVSYNEVVRELLDKLSIRELYNATFRVDDMKSLGKKLENIIKNLDFYISIVKEAKKNYVQIVHEQLKVLRELLEL